jgi:hypothetical protein
MGSNPLEVDSRLSLEDSLSICYEKEGAINAAEFKRLRLELYDLRCTKEKLGKIEEPLKHYEL